MNVESSSSLLALSLAAAFLLLLMVKLLVSLWVSPLFVYWKLRSNGFSGPNPNFPLGNLNLIKNEKLLDPFSNNIHSYVFPFFSEWQKSYGKVFVYWIGTEPFVYVADPEFLREMTAEIDGKSWGKPDIFKEDRDPMFGKGLVMIEGQDWLHHRRIIAPAFAPSNLKEMTSCMVESGRKMVDRWAAAGPHPEINAENELIRSAGEIIARTSFGISFHQGHKVFDKLREMQITLFKSSHYVGVPFGKFLNLKRNMKAKSLGREIDSIIHGIIINRMNKTRKGSSGNDLLGLLLGEDSRNKGCLEVKELVDECKTFFFGGHETTALALTWTLLLLGRNPNWQDELREEIQQVIGDGDAIDAITIARLKKMGWVMNEVLRLYPPAPNVQRQARQDIRVGDIVIPKGTNIWVDIVSMHHDYDLWGDDVHEFRPERFKDDGLCGGCNHRMGYLPFGFGGRRCVGRNLMMMEYKIVLSLILLRFSFSVSPDYCHFPGIMLSLRPMHGLPLRLRHL